MQARSRCRDSPGPLGENRLVTLAVLWLITPRDVGRQRNVAEVFDRDVHVALGCEPKPPQPVFAAADHFGDEFSRSEMNALAQLHLSAWTNQGLPFIRRHLPRQQDLNLGGQELSRYVSVAARFLRASTGAPPKQSRWNDSRIVHDDQFV